MQVGWAKKRDSGRISGFAAYSSTVLSTVRVAKCEKQFRDERRQASSTHRGVRRPLFEQDDDEVSVTGSTLYAGDEGRSKFKPPLVITPVFCCRRTEPGGYVCRKLTLTRTPDPIRPTRRGLDPNRSTNGSKQGGL